MSRFTGEDPRPCLACRELFIPFNCPSCTQLPQHCLSCHNELAHDVLPGPGITATTGVPPHAGLCDRQRMKLNKTS